MKEVERFEVDGLSSRIRVTFDTHEKAEAYVRRQLYKAWVVEKSKKYPQLSLEGLICENYKSFKEELSDGNVLHRVQDKSVYVTSDGTEFHEKTAASIHEFCISLKALANKHDISAINVVSLAESVQTEMFNEE